MEILRYNLKLTILSLKKDALYSLVNVTGLSISICCCALIMLWVADEYSFDRFHSKKERLFKVAANAYFDGKINTWTVAPIASYYDLRDIDSRIISSAITDIGNEHIISQGDVVVKKSGNYASEEFFELFDFPFIEGKRSESLKEPKSIVLTASTAKALFGKTDVINKVVRIDNSTEVKVTGVIEDVLRTSTLQFDYILPWSLYEKTIAASKGLPSLRNEWSNYSYCVYVELAKAENESGVVEAIKRLPVIMEPNSNVPKELFLYPLLKWHLHTKFDNGVLNGGPIQNVKLFSWVAIIILAMACVNFMNLATTRAERRAREGGIRKAIGSTTIQIFIQFLRESLVISCVSLFIALLAVQLLLPLYNIIVQRNLAVDYADSKVWIFSVAIVVIVGVISGLYPALYRASFKPVEVLKGKVTSGAGESIVKKVLVTIQMTASIVLMIGTIIIARQVKHVKNRELGFKSENLVYVSPMPDILPKYDALKAALLQTGAVGSVTWSSSKITDVTGYDFLRWPGMPSDQKVLFVNILAHYDFLKTNGIKLIAGRDFDERFAPEKASVIINQAALDLMGFPDPIGERLEVNGQQMELIGVTENSISGSPYQAVQPLFITFDDDWVSTIAIRLNNSTNITGVLKEVEKVFDSFGSAYPFEYSFADVEFQKKFLEIELMDRLSTGFSILSLFITVLGLFALSSFIVERRLKEIGMRKVLGATNMKIVIYFSSSFARLIGLAFFMAMPVAYFVISNILLTYSYRISIPIWAFPLAGVLCGVFALLIVGIKVYRASYFNSISALRSE